jgi:outer membrane PBP1 activator LpoA protein
MPAPSVLLDQARASQGKRAAELFLQASIGFIEAGQHQDADAAFASIAPELLPSHLTGSYRILQIELALAAGEVEAAQTLIQALQNNPSHLQSVPSRRLVLLKARLCAANDDFQCAISELTSSRFANEDRQSVHDLIWNYLGQAPALMAAQQAELRTGVEQGWWALKASMLQSFSMTDQRRRLANWRSRWPRHPAALPWPQSLQEIDGQLWQPQKVGLLLPLSGPLARAGRAVRNGFISAYLYAAGLSPTGTPSQQTGYEVMVYDTARQPVASAYEQALLDEVDLLIGPLSKSAVAALNALNPDVPTLALNYLDTGTIPAVNLLQLGLAIEDEADTIVARLLDDGAERLLVFHNYDDWSQRAARRLASTWPFAVTVQSFTDIKTITESVGRAMQVEASQQRHDELDNLLGFELEFLPRARQDLDAVVALVNTVEANALVPALRFHFAQALPVYASSQSVRAAQPEQLSELGGFRVSELPWNLFSDPLYQDMAGAFNLPGNPLSSLYALGVDAFRVSDRLQFLAHPGSNQLLGSTGILTLRSDRRFSRELAWGVVSRAGVVPLPLLLPSSSSSSIPGVPGVPGTPGTDSGSL